VVTNDGDTSKDTDVKDTDTSKDDTDDKVAEGTFTGGINWSLDKDGTLTIGAGNLTKDTFKSGDKNFTTVRSQVKTLKIDGKIVLPDDPCNSVFSSMENLEHIEGLENISNAVDLSQFFSGCRNLQDIDLSSMDTSKVTDMSLLFFNCNSLKKIDLSKVNTSNVINMFGMFWYCNSMEKINVSNFDTSHVTSIQGMFSDCKSLTNIDISNFDTSNVSNRYGMSAVFFDCPLLEKVNVSGWDTSKCDDMSMMFSSDKKLKDIIGLSGFNTKNVTDMNYMFSGCESLDKIDISNFDTSNVTDMHSMFRDNKSISSLDVSNFDTSNVTDMSSIFFGDSSLEDLDISNFNVDKVSNAKEMFNDTKNLKDLKTSKGFNKISKLNQKTGLEDKTWIDIGTGTKNNPKPSARLSYKEWSNLDAEEVPNWFLETGTLYTGSHTVNVKNDLPDELGQDLTAKVPEKYWPEYIGSTFEVAVPEVEGYVAKEKFITVTATAEGLVSDDMVHYVKSDTEDPDTEDPDTEDPDTEDPDIEEPGNNNNGNNNNNSGNNNNNSGNNNNNNNSGNEIDEDKDDIENKQNLVTVHPDKEYANLYDSKGKLVDNSAFAVNSNWQSDQLLTINGSKYYRVATNEFVKADDSYTYEKVDASVKTKDSEITYMIKSTGKAVQNRGLGKQSPWKADKKANINGKVYYRVATNEFVSADEVAVM